MSDKFFQKVGVNEDTFGELLYEPSSKLLIAQFGRNVDGLGELRSVYARRSDEATYKRITPVSEDISFDDIVLLTSGRSAVINTFRARRVKESSGNYDWHSLRVVELPSGHLVRQVACGELGDSVHGYEVWISRLLGVSRDDEVLHVVAAFPESEAEGSTRIRYHVCDLSITDWALHKVSELQCVFV